MPNTLYIVYPSAICTCAQHPGLSTLCIRMLGRTPNSSTERSIEGSKGDPTERSTERSASDPSVDSALVSNIISFIH